MLAYFNDNEMQSFEELDNPDVNLLVSRLRVFSQELLLARMQLMALKYTGSVSPANLDFALWRAVIGVPKQLSTEEATELDQLSSQAGGWWSLDGSPTFLSFEEWQRVYDEREEQLQEANNDR